MRNRTMKSCAALLLCAVLAAGSMWGCKKDSDTTISVYHATMPDSAEESDIYVEPIEGLSDDFIRGMDISSVIAEEESGVKYYNAEGEEEDLFKILADAGVNYIRVRVWNNPYDKDGNGYGGGNCDVEKAAQIGRRAAENGMKLSVDFHYSDFWADPAKQFVPDEWAHVTFDDKKQALYDFTLESLKTIKEAGADIGMVQIGNEINNGMCGETEDDKVMELLKEGSKAVRDFSSDVKIAVHYTNIEDTKSTLARAQKLEDAGVDYDIFGVSYYAFWHGTMENMTSVLNEIKSTYNKDTCIMETSYAYTTEDTDGFANSVGEGDLLPEYAATIQSQATCVRDVMAAANEAGSLGVFYWEGAWISVGSDASANKELWEKYGSGWASSYSAKYDPDDAGQYYGGCSWDNQAFFDSEGKALASLDAFKYVKYGTICDTKVDFLEACSVEVNVGDELKLPETINAVMNNRNESGPVNVTWNADDVTAIDTSTTGEYTVKGNLDDGTEVSCNVKVAKVNYVKNPGFEENNTSMWKITYNLDTNPTDYQDKTSDALTGSKSLHFYAESDFEFNAEQTIENLTTGKYTLNANIQGDAVGSAGEIYLYIKVDGKEYTSAPVSLSGWVVWQTPEITDIDITEGSEVIVGMYVKSQAKGWGTIDDFYLYKQ